MDPLPPIPTPVAQRWREFRIQVLPFVIFVMVLAVVIFLWRTYVQPVGVVGEVEAIRANVTTLNDGLITAVLVQRFDEVKKGQPLCTVESSDVDVQKAELATVAADMAVLRTRISIDERQREQGYHRFRLEILDQKVSLAQAKALFTEASNNLVRVQGLVEQKVASPQDLDNALARRDSVVAEITERTALIQDLSQALPAMAKEVIPAGTDPIKDAIDAKEREIELLIKPSVLKSPIDGIVSVAYKQVGEKVLRGEPILTISDPVSQRVVGYIRQPINTVPTTNDLVEVRTRSSKRRSAAGQIVRVGAQLEPINPALISLDSTRLEHGLPVLIKIPATLGVIPGEFVDVLIGPSRN